MEPLEDSRKEALDAYLRHLVRRHGQATVLQWLEQEAHPGAGRAARVTHQLELYMRRRLPHDGYARLIRTALAVARGVVVE